MKRDPKLTPVQRVICDEDGVSNVILIMEDGKVCRIDVKKEMFVPDDPAAAWQAARRAVQRLTFWTHQTQRALRRVRFLQYELDVEKGSANITARRNLKNESMTDNTLDPSQFGVVSSFVAQFQSVRAAEEKLREAQFFYGTILGVTESFQRRLYLLGSRCRANTTFEA